MQTKPLPDHTHFLSFPHSHTNIEVVASLHFGVYKSLCISPWVLGTSETSEQLKARALRVKPFTRDQLTCIEISKQLCETLYHRSKCWGLDKEVNIHYILHVVRPHLQCYIQL